MKINYFSFVMIGLLLWQCRSVPEVKTSNSKVENFQGILDSVYQANPNCVGIMAHVEQPSKGISWSGSVGHPRKGSQEPIRVNQPALVASNTKTYVSAAILRLVEDGKLRLNDSIGPYLSQQTSQKMKEAGYDLTEIQIKHLLSHTSGVRDYVNDVYMQMLVDEPNHRWSRREQLELAFEQPPLYKCQQAFTYSDANYLLLTEIIECFTVEPFYDSLKKLLKYKDLNLNHTWFYSLDEPLKTTAPLVYQYSTSEGYNSYDVDPSFDLYGGGGIATTTHDLAVFTQNLFDGNIVQNPKILEQIFEIVPTKDGKPLDYGMGISIYRGLNGVGHGGFWGTQVIYLRDKKATISAFVLDRDFGDLTYSVIASLAEEL